LENSILIAKGLLSSAHKFLNPSAKKFAPNVYLELSSVFRHLRGSTGPGPVSSLVLDLDETLVRTQVEPHPNGFDFRVAGPGYYVRKRPHLDEFITRCQSWCDIAVWSAGGTGYVVPTVDILFEQHTKPLFVWCYPRCTRKYDENREEYSLKDLKKVKKRGFSLSRVLIVEDEARKVARNYGNLVVVREFLGDNDDTELLALADYLEQFKDCADVRKPEKRYWRNGR
jgi:carboxy-terminal domain RNA polymerase II polypeptide A small phosphatase